MDVQPRRLRERLAIQVERFRIERQIVRPQVGQNCGRGSARGAYDLDAPESPGRSVAL